MTLKREIKDAYLEGGNSIYVKTHSNAIYVDDNETETLTQRLDNVKDSITEHTSQLNEIDKKVKARCFKPKFGVNAYWGETTGYTGEIYNKSRSDILADLNNWEELGIDEIVVPIHIGYNTNLGSGSLYIVENLDDVLWAITQCDSLNIKIKAIKVHIQTINEAYILNTITWSVFAEQYKNLLSTIATDFLNTTVEIITVLNETEFIYTNSSYETFALECLNIAKTNGYKTGVTTAGWANNLSVLPSIINNSDKIFCNIYVSISCKMDRTTVEDSIVAWQTSGVDKWIEKMKKQYPNKEIVVSESGVQDYWVALISPSKWDWDDSLKVETNGKAPNIYLQGLLEMLNRDDIQHVWWWHNLYYNDIKETLNLKLKGGNQ